ncbi:MAG: hypothetical protein HKN82_10580 [Akkermansiaceae bacterium]|nr:hypothetical protein [Akkermansiaceae bacterium]
MWVELPAVWIAVLNVLAIPAIHMGVSWLFTRLPRALFRPGGSLFRERLWEDGGRFYERFMAIRTWKGWLPDAAPWFDGFAKKSLARRDPDYLRAFRAETCRSEAAHYAQIPALLLTVAWNPWPVAASVMTAYALASNLPCIVLQRHTRHRMARLLAALTKRGRTPGRK